MDFYWISKQQYTGISQNLLIQQLLGSVSILARASLIESPSGSCYLLSIVTNSKSFPSRKWTDAPNRYTSDPSPFDILICVFFVEFVAFYQNYIFAQFFFLLLFPLLPCCIVYSTSDWFFQIQNTEALTLFHASDFSAYSMREFKSPTQIYNFWHKSRLRSFKSCRENFQQLCNPLTN